jgi:hypothetical protein
MFTTAAFGQSPPLISKEVETARTNAYEKQLTEYLTNYLVDEYEARAAKAWNRDYSSIPAFKRSVEPNRERWASVVIKPPVLRKTGAVKIRPYVLGNLKAEWIEVPLGMITAEAILAFPPNASKDKPVPIVIVQHGIGSDPESTFDENGSIATEYHAYARALLKAGFAVLAPLNLRDIERRNNIESLCRLANISLPGIELVRLQNLLDTVLNDPRVNEEKVAMWGVSWGGLATMFFMPLEPRIKAGVVAAFFNERTSKMVFPDKRTSFWPKETHAAFSGWLTEFSDQDLVSLICPRPLMIQTGKKDGIGYWQRITEEFNKAKMPYQNLGVGDRISLLVHEGIHETIVDDGVNFLIKWLKEDDEAK